MTLHFNTPLKSAAATKAIPEAAVARQSLLDRKLTVTHKKTFAQKQRFLFSSNWNCKLLTTVIIEDGLQFTLVLVAGDSLYDFATFKH